MTDNTSWTSQGQKDNRTDDEIVESIQAGNTDDIAVLWEKNLPLIRWTIQNKIKPSEQDFEDLTQQAYFGFMRAVRTFVPHGKYQFSTFVVRNTIDSLRKYYDRGPGHVQEKIQVLVLKYEDIISHSETQNSILQDIEVMDKLNISARILETIKKAALYKSSTSLDKILDCDSNYTPMAFQKSTSNTERESMKGIYFSELHECISTALSELTPLQRNMIIAYYYQGVSQTEAAKVYGSSRENVRNAIKAGLKRMREGKYSRTLKEFL